MNAGKEITLAVCPSCAHALMNDMQPPTRRFHQCEGRMRVNTVVIHCECPCGTQRSVWK